MAQDRTTQFMTWLQSQLCRLSEQKIQQEDIQLKSLMGDAGFRQYFRIESPIKHRFLAVDAPASLSNNVAFVELSKAFTHFGITVPQVWAFDQANGFLILDDLGDTQFIQSLTDENLLSWYQRAIDELIKITTIDYANSQLNLPDYDDKFVYTELSIFKEWLLEQYLEFTLTTEQKEKLEQSFSLLVANVAEQPKVVMHRDYHSRNLMVVDGQIAVIDFQDAVYGAVSYDIVSLLRDCYKKLPSHLVQQLWCYFIERLSSANTSLDIAAIDQNTWQRWFDLMGLQRHLKASGIFARLALRDNKLGYLPDIPLTLDYIVEVSANYSELAWLGKFVKNQVKPAVLEKCK